MTGAEETVAREILASAKSLIDRSSSDTRGLWPRAAVLLQRQALEVALKTYWSAKARGVEECSTRAQFLCLGSYLRNEPVARRAHLAWTALSWRVEGSCAAPRTMPSSSSSEVQVKVRVDAEGIQRAVLKVRGLNVLLDAELADLYGVDVRALNQAVARNADRFPCDFMFKLTAKEAASLRSQSVILEADRGRNSL